jgi:hypothetical protein
MSASDPQRTSSFFTRISAPRLVRKLICSLYCVGLRASSGSMTIYPPLEIPETLAAGPGPGNTDPRVLERFAKTGTTLLCSWQSCFWAVCS